METLTLEGEDTRIDGVYYYKLEDSSVTTVGQTLDESFRAYIKFSRKPGIMNNYLAKLVKILTGFFLTLMTK